PTGPSTARPMKKPPVTPTTRPETIIAPVPRSRSDSMNPNPARRMDTASPTRMHPATIRPMPAMVLNDPYASTAYRFVRPKLVPASVMAGDTTPTLPGPAGTTRWDAGRHTRSRDGHEVASHTPGWRTPPW